VTIQTIKLFRKIAGYPLFDHKRNGDIFEELKVEPVGRKLSRCKSNWLRYVKGMNNRMPKIVLNCRPVGQRL